MHTGVPKQLLPSIVLVATDTTQPPLLVKQLQTVLTRTILFLTAIYISVKNLVLDICKHKRQIERHCVLDIRKML